MIELSVVIPARREEWLSRTVSDVISNSSDRSEVIVVLDGDWSDPPLEQHPRVQVIREPVVIGQRAATNLGARVSQAKYLMKCDAHVAFAPGFDVALIEAAKELGSNCTQIPAQKNLHVYDQVCVACNARSDQAPALKACKVCGAKELRKEIVWQPRQGKTTTNWVLDSELHFQYASNRQQTGDICDVMSSLGACFFMERARFWELGGLDEAHGSWGQLGAEVALKSWLSGGRHVVNKRTWFAHFFRVGGIQFPYDIKASEQEYARTYSRNLWRGNHWEGQVLPLRWLVDKFWPIKGWREEDRDELPRTLSRAVSEATVAGSDGASGAVYGLRVENRPASGDALSAGRDRVLVAEPQKADSHIRQHIDTSGGSKGLVYYTDNRGDEAIMSSGQSIVPYKSAGIVFYTHGKGDTKILVACREQLQRVSAQLPLVSVSLFNDVASDTLVMFDGFGHKNIGLREAPGILTMFRQILTGLEALDTEYAFLAEHDCLYSAEHFKFRPPNDSTYFYNLNWWKVDAATGRAVTYEAKQTSQLCANRQLLIEHYRKRIARVEAEGFSRAMGFEPGSHRRRERVDDIPSDVWRSAVPNVDIRHGHNLTPSRWRRDQFKSQRYCQNWQEAESVPGWDLSWLTRETVCA